MLRRRMLCSNDPYPEPSVGHVGEPDDFRGVPCTVCGVYFLDHRHMRSHRDRKHPEIKSSRGLHESVAVRRCKRLRRAATEQLNQGCGGELSDAQRRHFCAALADGLEPNAIPGMPANQFATMDFANRALQTFSLREAAANKTSWVKRFKTWSLEACLATKAIVKPQAPSQPTTAEELEDEWSTLSSRLTTATAPQNGVLLPTKVA